jgi:hypothetical protein
MGYCQRPWSLHDPCLPPGCVQPSPSFSRASGGAAGDSDHYIRHMLMETQARHGPRKRGSYSHFRCHLSVVL